MTPTITHKKESMTLEEMQKAVGGYIEIAYDDGKTQIICNEEGKLLGLPLNVEATRMWGELIGTIPNDVLVGDVLILTDKGRLS